MKIIPAILVQSEAEFLEQVRAIEGTADCIHLDIADGEFVPETTWADPGTVSNTLKIDCELHLMVKNPLEEIERWANVPQVKRILFHQQTALPDWQKLVNRIHELGWKAILTTDHNSGNTPEVMLRKTDGLMITGVDPGGQGRPFNHSVPGWIAEKKLDNPTQYIQVDGGMNAQTIPEIKAAGADAICVGSAIFGHGDPAENLNTLKTIL